MTHNISELLKAIADLLWPLLGFCVLFVFKAQIADIAKRLKKGKLLGQEIELNESLELLDRTAIAVEKQVAALPPPDQKAGTNDALIEQIKIATSNDESLARIVNEASRSPKAALISLALELESAVRSMLARAGHLQRRYVSPIQATELLSRQFGLSSYVADSLRLFWQTRNQIIHKGDAADEAILRALDSGLTLLKALRAIPLETNVVYRTNIELFRDEKAQHKLHDVTGVMLETIAPDKSQKSYRIFPTTKTDYKIGSHVAWEWNMSQAWGDTWYKNPETHQIEYAWSSSAEFVGRHLEEL